MQSELWTLNRLAVELGRDRRALARDLDGLEPDHVEAMKAGRMDRRWRLKRVVEHLYAGGAGELDGPRERARKDKESADKLAMENAVRRGELIEMEEVERGYGSLVMAARARLIQLPDAIGQFCPPSVAGVVIAEVRKRVYEALTDLANTPEPTVHATTAVNGERVGGQDETVVEREQRGAGTMEN